MDTQLAPYASHPARSRGRLHKEEECNTRSVFQRDRDRIIHSAAFRRLEYKTQVFINHEGDHYRTRLTHSLEVAQLARSASRALGLNEDLAEALALAHDLGHTPFGHAGEDGMKEMLADYGGFDHNAQTLRILTALEHRYAGFDGLNLSWETLEGIAKHNGPVNGALPWALAEYNTVHDLELSTHAGAEAQVAALCDDIAYHNHDMEDGIRAGLFTIGDLAALPLMCDVISEVGRIYGTLEERRRVHEVIRRVIGLMVEDLLAESRRRLAAKQVESVEAVRMLGSPVIQFSQGMLEVHRALKEFLYENMYRHFRVNRMTSKARRIIRELFSFYFTEPECLPTEWRALASPADDFARARCVADFVAGMTDRFAMDEYKRIFDMETVT